MAKIKPLNISDQDLLAIIYKASCLLSATEILPQPKDPSVYTDMLSKEEYQAYIDRLKTAGLTEIRTQGVGKGMLFPVCPFGSAGDVFFIREAFFKAPDGKIYYKIDDPNTLLPNKGFWKSKNNMAITDARFFIRIKQIKVVQVKSENSLTRFYWQPQYELIAKPDIQK